MKWKKPAGGDCKAVKHFAIFPKEVQGYTVWLEVYYSLYQFRAIWGGWWHDRDVVAEDYEQLKDKYPLAKSFLCKKEAEK